MRGSLEFGGRGWGLKSLTEFLVVGFIWMSLERTSWGEFDSVAAAVEEMESVGVGDGGTMGNGGWRVREPSGFLTMLRSL